MSFKIKKKALTRPELSIIIPVHNALSYLDKCLISLQKIEAVNYEIILVDDNSDEQTKHYLEQIQQLNIVHHQQSKGFIESCHAGAQKAIGTFLLFLNSDTEIIESLGFRK